MTDSLLNKVAESARVTTIASLGLDVVFYSARCVSQVPFSSKSLNDSARQSIWLSVLAICTLAADSVFLIEENRTCRFELLRKHYRWNRKVSIYLQKKEKEEENIAKVDGRSILLSAFRKDKRLKASKDRKE
jgi:uncharacterized protein (UPF0128 family)